MKDDKEQLLTQSEVAALKGGMSLQLLAHHLAKPDAPRPVEQYGKKLYRALEVAEWRPRRARSTTNRGVSK